MSDDQEIGKECRERPDPFRPHEQWYYDEFLGIYRQNAPHLAQPQPLTPSTPQQQTLVSSSSPSSSPWPTPTSVHQVNRLLHQALEQLDPPSQLDLCQFFVDTPVDHQEIKQAMLENALFLLRHITKSGRQYTSAVDKSAEGEALFLLANCYGSGLLGLTQNHSHAFQRFIQASKLNHAEATYRAAVCYALGIGTRQDNRRAMAFYRKAAQLGHRIAMYKLGMALLLGHFGQPVNLREGVTWIYRAASLSHPEALHVLALLYLSGECAEANLIADQTYVVELLHQSATLGHVRSQVKLGQLYEQGYLVDGDDTLSIHWYTSAAEAGSAEAALALSGWYLTGSNGSLAQSDEQAYLWARKAVSLATNAWTMAKACYVLGMYTERGIAANAANAAHDAAFWFQKAAELGHKNVLPCQTPETSPSIAVDPTNKQCTLM